MFLALAIAANPAQNFIRGISPPVRADFGDFGHGGQHYFYLLSPLIERVTPFLVLPATNTVGRDWGIRAGDIIRMASGSTFQAYELTGSSTLALRWIPWPAGILGSSSSAAAGLTAYATRQIFPIDKIKWTETFPAGKKLASPDWLSVTISGAAYQQAVVILPGTGDSHEGILVQLNFPQTWKQDTVAEAQYWLQTANAVSWDGTREVSVGLDVPLTRMMGWGGPLYIKENHSY